MAIPKAGTRLLRVHIEGGEYLVMTLAEWFKRSPQAGKLYRISRPCPGPPILQEAIVDVVGGRGTDVGGQSGYEVRGHLRSQRQGGRDPQLIAREKAADIDLIRCGDAQFEVAVARHEVPLVPKVVVQARNPEVAGLREGD